MQRHHQFAMCPQCQKALAAYHDDDDPALFCPRCRFPLLEIAGKYRLVDKIAQGGFATLYRAIHVGLKDDAERVVKVLQPDLFGSPGIAARYWQEIQVTANLSQRNPHIVRIYDDFGEIPNFGSFYVMEYVRGETLRKRLQHPLPLAEIVHLFGQLCEAMQAAHEAGVLHRDLKPENIMVTQQSHDLAYLKVLDFGIARCLQENQAATPLTQGPIGTPAYMSPEQHRNQPPDEGTDIFAMGVILYELLTGTHPFAPAQEDPGHAWLEAIIATPHIEQKPTPLHRRWPPGQALPTGLEQVVHTALSWRRHDRFPSVKAMQAALRACFHLPHTGHPQPPQEHPPSTTHKGQEELRLSPNAEMASDKAPSTPSVPLRTQASPRRRRRLQQAPLPSDASTYRASSGIHQRVASQPTQWPPQASTHTEKPAPPETSTQKAPALRSPQPIFQQEIADAIPDEPENIVHQHRWLREFGLAMAILVLVAGGYFYSTQQRASKGSAPSTDNASQATTRTQAGHPPPSFTTQKSEPSADKTPSPATRQRDAAPQAAPPGPRHAAPVAQLPNKPIPGHHRARDSRLALLRKRSTHPPRRHRKPRRSEKRSHPNHHRKKRSHPSHRSRRSHRSHRSHRHHARIRPHLVRARVSPTPKVGADNPAPAPDPTLARSTPVQIGHLRSRPGWFRHVNGCPATPLFWVYLRFASKQHKLRPQLSHTGKVLARGDGYCVGVGSRHTILTLGSRTKGFVPCQLTPALLPPSVGIEMQREGDLEPNLPQYCVSSR